VLIGHHPGSSQGRLRLLPTRKPRAAWGSLLDRKNQPFGLHFWPKRFTIRNNNLKSLPTGHTTTSYEPFITTTTSSITPTCCSSESSPSPKRFTHPRPHHTYQTRILSADLRAILNAIPVVLHIPIEDLPRDALRRLQDLQLDDEDGLCELRIKGASRVWGFRRGNVIHVLWWDPDHTVFPGSS
jgi:hypothetical protein